MYERGKRHWTTRHYCPTRKGTRLVEGNKRMTTTHHPLIYREEEEPLTLLDVYLNIKLNLSEVA